MYTTLIVYDKPNHKSTNITSEQFVWWKRTRFVEGLCFDPIPVWLYYFGQAILVLPPYFKTSRKTNLVLSRSMNWPILSTANRCLNSLNNFFRGINIAGQQIKWEAFREPGNRRGLSDEVNYRTRQILYKSMPYVTFVKRIHWS